jgi:hypothetical protein
LNSSLNKTLGTLNLKGTLGEDRLARKGSMEEHRTDQMKQDQQKSFSKKANHMMSSVIQSPKIKKTQIL